MEMYIWENYNKDEISPQLKYWADYWVESVDQYRNTKLGTIFENPKTLLSLIQDEIDFNNLQSKEMRNYLVKRVKYYLKNDFILDKISINFFQNLENAIMSGSTELIYWNAFECEKSMGPGNYVSHLISSLTRLITANGEVNKIKIISDALIVEFLIAGFGTEYIKKIPRKIFSFYQELTIEHFSTDFPHRIDLENYKKMNGEHDYKGYYEAIKQEIALITIEDRLNSISRLYFSAQEELTIIFPLKGARGDVGEIRVGDIHIYSPKTFNYLKDKLHEDRMPDEFNSSNKLQFTPSNVAIKIKVLDPESSKAIAILKIRECLNLLHFYLPGNVELSVDENECYIVNNKGQPRHQSFSADRKSEFWFWQERSIDLADIPDDIIKDDRVVSKFFSQSRDNRTSKFSYEQITNALHFLNKSKREETPEDRLVNLWVCLEKLVADRKTLFSIDKSKFSLIMDLIPYVVVDSFYSRAWDSFHYMRRLFTSSQGGLKLLPLDHELAEKIHFIPKKGTYIILKDFIDNLDEIKASTNKTFLHEKIDLLKKFYFDGKKSFFILEEDVENIKRDLLLIYRIRNRIVHDAHFDSVSIEFWADRLNFYVRSCLGSVIDNYCNGDDKIYDFLVRKKVTFQHKQACFKNGTIENIYDLVFNESKI